MPEGTPAFGNEPLLAVEAPLPEAQVVETYLINQVHFQTLRRVEGRAHRDGRGRAARPPTSAGGARTARTPG